MKKEIAVLTIEEKAVVYGGCVCKCKHTAPVKAEDLDWHHTSHRRHHGHHVDDHHGSIYVPEETSSEYILGEASSITDCNEGCQKKGDTMVTCLAN